MILLPSTEPLYEEAKNNPDNFFLDIGRVPQSDFYIARLTKKDTDTIVWAPVWAPFVLLNNKDVLPNTFSPNALSDLAVFHDKEETAIVWVARNKGVGVPKKWELLWVTQSYYSRWEDVSFDSTQEEGLVTLRDYRSNDPSTSHRLISRNCVRKEYEDFLKAHQPPQYSRVYFQKVSGQLLFDNNKAIPFSVEVPFITFMAYGVSPDNQWSHVMDTISVSSTIIITVEYGGQSRALLAGGGLPLDDDYVADNILEQTRLLLDNMHRLS